METPSPSPTLREQGYRLPAEWEQHTATWLAFPVPDKKSGGHSHWPYIFNRSNVQRYWGQMTKALIEGEDVHILVKSSEARERISCILNLMQVESPRIHLHNVPYDWSWIRDSGGITVVNDKGGRIMTNWGFNGWGDQWNYTLDNEVPIHMSQIAGIARHDINMILEGGSIDTNGKGTLLTTEDCLLNEDRNLPGQTRTRDQIEQALYDNLGIRKILWLGRGIGGDDTSGHIDDLTRFVSDDTVVTMIERDTNDMNFEPLNNNVKRLRTMRTESYKQLTVIELPMPKPLYSEKTGQRLPATYANFYIGNESVLVPIFNDKENDGRALIEFECIFRGRRIQPIDARDLVVGLGTFHCSTMQEPAPVRWD